MFVRKLVLANQRSERWFSHVKKMIRPIRIANDVFSRVRKTVMEWNSFVCFTVDKENGREQAKQQRKGKNRTRHKLLLCFLSELLCLSFKLTLKPAILLKFTHFQLCIENKQLRFLIVLGLLLLLIIFRL